MFDLDGTILDTADDILTAVRAALGRAGDAVTREHIFANGLWDAETLVSRCARDVGATLADPAAAAEAFRKAYVACFTEKTRPFAGIPELLAELSAHGIKTAAYSNKEDGQTKTLCRVSFGKGVPDVVRGAVPGVPLKPSPEGAALVLAEAGVRDARAVVYVGDSAVDMQTAKNAGFHAVGVTWGFSPREALAGADEIADTVAELRAIILKEAF